MVADSIAVIKTPEAAMSLDLFAKSLFSGDALSTTFSIAELKISVMYIKNIAVTTQSHSDLLIS